MSVPEHYFRSIRNVENKAVTLLLVISFMQTLSGNHTKSDKEISLIGPKSAAIPSTLRNSTRLKPVLSQTQLNIAGNLSDNNPVIYASL